MAKFQLQQTDLGKIAAFVKERDEAILSLDEKKIRAYMRRHNVRSGDGMPPRLFWGSIHKVRMMLETATEEQRAESRAWLEANGFSPGFIATSRAS